MPLVKFEPLQHGIDQCWIELLKVSSIWPLLGAPAAPEGETVDLGMVREIGCRVGVEGKIFDLTVLGEDLATQVAAARTENLEAAWWRSPNAARPH